MMAADSQADPLECWRVHAFHKWVVWQRNTYTSLPQVCPLRWHLAVGAMWSHATGQIWSQKLSIGWCSWHGTCEEGGSELLHVELRNIQTGYFLKKSVWKGLQLEFIMTSVMLKKDCTSYIWQEKVKQKEKKGFT
jgi:hypothetical protein